MLPVSQPLETDPVTAREGAGGGKEHLEGSVPSGCLPNSYTSQTCISSARTELSDQDGEFLAGTIIRARAYLALFAKTHLPNGRDSHLGSKRRGSERSTAVIRPARPMVWPDLLERFPRGRELSVHESCGSYALWLGDPMSHLLVATPVDLREVGFMCQEIEIIGDAGIDQPSIRVPVSQGIETLRLFTVQASHLFCRFFTGRKLQGRLRPGPRKITDSQL